MDLERSTLRTEYILDQLGSKTDCRSPSIRKINVVDRVARQSRLSSELVGACWIVLSRVIECTSFIIPIGTGRIRNVIQFVVVSRPVVSGTEARGNLVHGVGSSKRQLACAVENVAALGHVDPFVWHTFVSIVLKN